VTHGKSTQLEPDDEIFGPGSPLDPDDRYAERRGGRYFTISTSYQNLFSNAEGKGMLDRILTEAFRRIGFKVEIVYIHPQRNPCQM